MLTDTVCLHCLHLGSSGDNIVGPISVNTTSEWNKLNMSNLGPQTELWTSNGKSLDSLYLFKGIPDGKPLFKLSIKEPNALIQRDMLLRSFGAHQSIFNKTF